MSHENNILYSYWNICIYHIFGEHTASLVFVPASWGMNKDSSILFPFIRLIE